MGKKIIIKGADFSANAVATNAIPISGLAIGGGDNIDEGVRQVQLGILYSPSNTTQRGVVWSVQGDATITQDGLLTYIGVESGSVIVTATSTKVGTISSSKTIAFVVPSVETPTFSPASGTYSSAQMVAIACATDGATIHYTTDGSTPTTSSPVYSSAIAVAESMTIKAIAVKNGNSSAIATADYVINATLVVNVTDENDNAVTDAVVMFGNDALTHAGNGVYMADVPRGATNTLSVSKSLYITHTQEVVINDNTITINVSLAIDPVMDIMDVQGARSVANLCPSAYKSKIMLQKGTGNNLRGGALIPVANASIPTPWSSDSTASDAEKGANSCPEWPSWAEVLDVVVTAPVSGAKCGIFLGDTPRSGTSAQAYTGGGWLSSISKRFLRTNYPNVLYIAISFDKQVSMNNAQLKQYVSIMAFKDIASADAWYAEHGGTAPNVQS